MFRRFEAGMKGRLGPRARSSLACGLLLLLRGAAAQARSQWVKERCITVPAEQSELGGLGLAFTLGRVGVWEAESLSAGTSTERVRLRGILYTA